MKREELRALIEREGSFEFSRSGGPGGQNVDTTSTKVTLRLPLAILPFAEEEMQRLRHRLSGLINREDELLVRSSETRSQHENRRRAISRAADLIAGALQQKKKRRTTRPPRRAKERRLEKKKRRGEIKRYRSTPKHDE
jgi:ribosome-associated protein